MEVELASAKLTQDEGLGSPSLYATFTWEMPGAQPQSFRTEAAKPALAPEWRHKARLSFERGKSATRFFERRKCALEVWAAARGIGTWFGAEDALLGRAEFRISTLLSQATWFEEIPLRRVTAKGEAVTLGFVKVQLRLRTPLEAQAAASPPTAPPSAPPSAPPLAAAAEEEDDSEFANSIVSYNVLEWELGRLSEQVAAMQAKGQLVPFAYGIRQEALVLRRDLMQIQVQTGQLSMASYLQQLREAIPQEVARAKALKAQPGGERRAVQHLRRVKIMTRS